nr:PREDICTED: pancreatic secretory granule membrane major glycoprotein GP2 [Equus przewalskii]
MASSCVLWLALASCILTLASTQQQTRCCIPVSTSSNSYGPDLECGAPGTPEAQVCFDPCKNYTFLNESSRSSENTERGQICDSNLRGWYRFVGKGGVRMPETCVPVYRCQTDAPMWLEGTHPTLKQGIVKRTACAQWSGSCCLWKTEVEVKACPGGYHVYRLEGTPECALSYCTDPTTEEPNCGKDCYLEDFVNGTWNCVCRKVCNSSDDQSLQPQLDCGAKEITLTLDESLLKCLGLGDKVRAYLRDHNCSSIIQRGEKSSMSVTSPTQAGACGNILERNETHVIYKNTLFLTNDFIIRDNILINFQCAYPLDMNVSPETVLQPIVSNLTISVDGEGEFIVKMALFQDQNYTLPYEGDEVVLDVDSILYVSAILESGDTSRFKLLLRHCYATPTENRTDALKYFIIKNGCPNQEDSTIHVEQNGVSSESQFSVQLFKFAGDHDLVYLHCEFHLCDPLNETCKPSCSGNQLKSTEVVINSAQVLDLGPITQKRTSPEPVMSGAPTTAGFLVAWLMVLLPVLLAGLF